MEEEEERMTTFESVRTTMNNMASAITVQSKLLEILSGVAVPHPLYGTSLTSEELLALFADSHTENEVGEA
jgi:hypothetical protein